MKLFHNIKVIATVLLVIAMCITLISCGGVEKSADTLVIGNGQMNGVFSPFFVETADDEVIVQLTSLTLLRLGSSGQPEDYAAKYETPVEITDEYGNVEFTKYRFELLEDLRFSDGEPVTADDIIFSLKVLCDPEYNGLSAIGTLPIVGLQEYKYDTENYEQVIMDLQEQAREVPSSYVEEYIMQMAEADCNAYPKEEIAAYVGIELDPSLSEEEQMEVLIQSYYEFELQNSYDWYLEDAMAAYFKELESAYLADKKDGASVNEISGVKKLDERTVEITLEGVNPSAIWALADLVVAPEHYYCAGLEGGSYTKGQLDEIRKYDSTPLGAGPYVFEKFENNVVGLNANEYYHLGVPEISRIKVVSSNSANIVDSILLSEIDIAEIPATADEYNKAQEGGLSVIATDFQGYGYIGINCGNIADKNVRKGLMCLMNREPAVNTYFGGMAKIIERPASASSWAYPDDAKPVYSYDVEKALDYFELAGYRQTEKNGSIVLEKDGKQLRITAGVGGEGIMDHPAALVFTQMKTDLEALGGSLEIIDSDMNVLVEGLYQGNWDLWAASWELGIDPDMGSRYMTNAEGNYYGISDPVLDELLVKAVSTSDIEKRKKYYQEAMNIIMEEAIELPLYQRQSLKVFNPEVIDSSSLPEEITGYHGYLEEIHKLKLIEK